MCLIELSQSGLGLSYSTNIHKAFMLLSWHEMCVLCAVVVRHINWIINSDVKMEAKSEDLNCSSCL